MADKTAETAADKTAETAADRTAETAADRTANVSSAGKPAAGDSAKWSTSGGFVYYYDRFDSKSGISGVRFPNSIQRVQLGGRGTLEKLYDLDSDGLENVHALGIDATTGQLIVLADLPRGERAILKGDREGRGKLETYFSFYRTNKHRVALAMAVSSDGYAYLATNVNAMPRIERLSLNITGRRATESDLELLYKIEGHMTLRDKRLALDEAGGRLFFMLSNARVSSIYRGAMRPGAMKTYARLSTGNANPDPVNFYTGQFVYVGKSQRLYFSNQEDPDGIFSIHPDGEDLATIISDAAAGIDDPSLPALGVSALGFDPVSGRLVFAPDEGGNNNVAVFPLRTCTLAGDDIQDVNTSDGKPVEVQAVTALTVH